MLHIHMRWQPGKPLAGWASDPGESSFQNRFEPGLPCYVQPFASLPMPIYFCPPPPCTSRYHIIGFHPRSYAWWGGLSYMIGAVQYNVASTTGLAYNFPRVAASWSTDTYKWASIVMYTWGGGFFLIAGVCYVLLDMGLPGLWLGMLPLIHQYA